MDILAMQAKAQEAKQARAEALRAYHAGFPYPSTEAQMAALQSLPYPRAQHGDVECEAIVPENRTAYRRRHNRFIWWVGGKRASIEEAAATLAACKCAA